MYLLGGTTLPKQPARGLDMPKTGTAPHFEHGLTDIEVPEGCPVELACQVFGTPGKKFLLHYSTLLPANQVYLYHKLTTVSGQEKLPALIVKYLEVLQREENNSNPCCYQYPEKDSVGQYLCYSGNSVNINVYTSVMN